MSLLLLPCFRVNSTNSLIPSRNTKFPLLKSIPLLMKHQQILIHHLIYSESYVVVNKTCRKGIVVSRSITLSQKQTNILSDMFDRLILNFPNSTKKLVPSENG